MRRSIRRLAVLAVGVCALALVTSAGGQDTGRALSPTVAFYVPGFETAAKQQWAKLIADGDRANADLLQTMESTSHAVWITGGSPNDARVTALKTVNRAADKNQVAVLVAYNTPFRDCAQYSAGGASDTSAYAAWIDGLARGIGDHQAVVLLEPDSLGIIPYNTDLNGNAEWCKPDLSRTGLTPAQANAERFTQLNDGVDRLEQQPNVSVYLDGTHNGWLGVGDAAQRLVHAGVLRAQGVFLNVSNYQPMPQLEKYGTWISQCIAFSNSTEEGGWRLGHYSWCASQYYPANSNDFSSWHLTDEWYAGNIGHAVPTAHFVIDTSRNGKGPNTMTSYAAAPFNQPPSVIGALQGGNWCNPPGAGLGLRPTADTGLPLLDAFLWVKIPGQSDGQCDAAGGARAWDYAAYTQAGWPTDATGRSHFDPLWGLVDPAAGEWFPQQALQLAQNAEPALD